MVPLNSFSSYKELPYYQKTPSLSQPPWIPAVRDRYQGLLTVLWKADPSDGMCALRLPSLSQWKRSRGMKRGAAGHERVFGSVPAVR